LGRPVIEHDRLRRRDPIEMAVRDGTIWAADIHADGQIMIVSLKEIVQAQRLPDLPKAGVDVEKDPAGSTAQKVRVSQEAHDV